MKNQEKLLQALLRSPKTVFSINEVALLYPIDTDNLISQLSYYVKRGYLYHIKRGLYAKDKNCTFYEIPS
jgi:predicted transcriptional regulator of viral defense system